MTRLIAHLVAAYLPLAGRHICIGENAWASTTTPGGGAGTERGNGALVA